MCDLSLYRRNESITIHLRTHITLLDLKFCKLKGKFIAKKKSSSAVYFFYHVLLLAWLTWNSWPCSCYSHGKTPMAKQQNTSIPHLLCFGWAQRTSKEFGIWDCLWPQKRPIPSTQKPMAYCLRNEKPPIDRLQKERKFMKPNLGMVKVDHQSPKEKQSNNIWPRSLICFNSSSLAERKEKCALLSKKKQRMLNTSFPSCRAQFFSKPIALSRHDIGLELAWLQGKINGSHRPKTNLKSLSFVEQTNLNLKQLPTAAGQMFFRTNSSTLLLKRTTNKISYGRLSTNERKASDRLTSKKVATNALPKEPAPTPFLLRLMKAHFPFPAFLVRKEKMRRPWFLICQVWSWMILVRSLQKQMGFSARGALAD